MAYGWESNMSHSFACPDATTAFIASEFPPYRAGTSSVTSDISSDNVSATLNSLKLGKAAGPYGLNNPFYRDYANALSSVLDDLYTRWIKCSVFPA